MTATAECGICKKQKVKSELFLDYGKSKNAPFFTCKIPCIGACCFYCDKKGLLKINGNPYRFCENCQPIFEKEIGFQFDPEEIRGIEQFSPDFGTQRDVYLRNTLYIQNEEGKFVAQEPRVIERKPKKLKRSRGDINPYSDQGTSSEDEFWEIDPGFAVSEERLKESKGLNETRSSESQNTLLQKTEYFTEDETSEEEDLF